MYCGERHKVGRYIHAASEGSATHRGECIHGSNVVQSPAHRFARPILTSNEGQRLPKLYHSLLLVPGPKPADACSREQPPWLTTPPKQDPVPPWIKSLVMEDIARSLTGLRRTTPSSSSPSSPGLAPASSGNWLMEEAIKRQKWQLAKSTRGLSE